VAGGSITVRVQLHLRYLGTDSALPVELPGAAWSVLREAFDAMHLQRFGFASPDKPIEIEAVAVTAEGGGAAADEPDMPPARGAPASQTSTRIFTKGAWHDAPVFLREGLAPGRRVQGPALIIEAHQTVMVEPFWQAEITPRNDLLLTRVAEEASPRAGTDADPVLHGESAGYDDEENQQQLPALRDAA